LDGKSLIFYNIFFGIILIKAETLERKKTKQVIISDVVNLRNPQKNHEKFMLLITGNDLPRILKSVTAWKKGTREFYKKSH
jgi:hypothetical protein